MHADAHRTIHFHIFSFVKLVICYFCLSSTTLKLDGMKRVWGREGYLAQKEVMEEAIHIEVPSPVRSPNHQAEADSVHSQAPTSTQSPEPEQGKQQLASSLFGSLSSQSSVCLVSLHMLLCGVFMNNVAERNASYHKK